MNTDIEIFNEIYKILEPLSDDDRAKLYQRLHSSWIDLPESKNYSQ